MPSSIDALKDKVLEAIAEFNQSGTMRVRYLGVTSESKVFIDLRSTGGEEEA